MRIKLMIICTLNGVRLDWTYLNTLYRRNESTSINYVHTNRDNSMPFNYPCKVHQRLINARHVSRTERAQGACALNGPDDGHRLITTYARIINAARARCAPGNRKQINNHAHARTTDRTAATAPLTFLYSWDTLDAFTTVALTRWPR